MHITLLLSPGLRDKAGKEARGLRNARAWRKGQQDPEPQVITSLLLRHALNSLKWPWGCCWAGVSYKLGLHLENKPGNELAFASTASLCFCWSKNSMWLCRALHNCTQVLGAAMPKPSSSLLLGSFFWTAQEQDKKILIHLFINRCRSVLRKVLLQQWALQPSHNCGCTATNA